MGEEMTKDGKVLTATFASNIRKLIDNANELKIKREDLVTILPMREGYIMVYYYGG